jgi:adenylyl-sulfate kinase
MNSNMRNVYWIMGPTSSGKTTIAELFTQKLKILNVPIIHFDGDEVRNFFSSEFGFSNDERLRVIKTLVLLANKSLSAGLNVVISALTAYDDARKYVDNNVNNLIKVYIKCDIETCKLRDPKGLYHAAKKGEIDTLVGFNSEYLPPKHPDLTINTDFTSVITCVEQLLTFSKHIHE